LSSVENKKQVISLIFDELIRDQLFHQLVVTGQDPCSIEVNMKGKRSRFDLETKHEEANIIIIHQVLYCAEQARQIAVMSDDTDVESHGKERAILDIKATLAKHQKVMKNLLPVHAISGCDEVACDTGIGKGTVIKILEDDKYDLSAIGNVDAPLQKVIGQATCFVSACYGIKNSTDMSHTRLAAGMG